MLTTFQIKLRGCDSYTLTLDSHYLAEVLHQVMLNTNCFNSFWRAESSMISITLAVLCALYDLSTLHIDY